MSIINALIIAAGFIFPRSIRVMASWGAVSGERRALSSAFNEHVVRVNMIWFSVCHCIVALFHCERVIDACGNAGRYRYFII